MQTIVKRHSNKFDKFHDTLSVRGFKSYDDYLHSEQWKAFQDWYRSLKPLPKRCLVCGSPHYVLHHWNYENVGHEDPCDVIPLCQEHHTELHRWLAGNKAVALKEVERQLVECFGKTQRDAERLFRPFVKLLKVVNRKRRCKDCNRRIGDSHRFEVCWGCLKKVQKARPKKPPQETRECPGCRKMRPLYTIREDGRCNVCHHRAARKAKRMRA